MNNSDYKFYIEKMVSNFNKKYFTKILNLGNLYKKVITNNKNKNIITLLKKVNITKNYLNTIFNHPENIENNEFMTVELIHKICDEIDIEYVFEYSIPSIDMSNKLFIYVNKNINENEVFKTVQNIIDSLTFFIEYCILIKVPIEDIPIFKIYYTSLLKIIHDDPSIPFNVEQINSGITQNPSIMIWRKEEIIRCVVHELMHYYTLEFRFYHYPTKLKYDIYNKYRINALTAIRPNESFCEVFANVFNIIICLMRKKNNITYNDFTALLIKEINFSILQIAKIFVFLKYNSSQDFYISSINGFDLRQSKTDVLCYFYFKTQLLIHLDKFLSILNPYNTESIFYIKYSSKIPNFFDNFHKIITDKNKNVEMIITNSMEKILNLKDGEILNEGFDNKNLRFTLSEDTTT